MTPGDPGSDEIVIKVHRLSHTLENPLLLGLVRSLSVPLNSPALEALAQIPFHHLTEFRLECTSYPWAAAAQRETIPPLQTILRLPSLQRVHFWGYLEPISIIDKYFEGCSQNLRELRLALHNLDSYPGMQRECFPEGSSHALAEKKIAIVHVWVPRELESWMRGFQCPFGFTQIRSLEVRASDWAALHDFFAPCLTRLEYLWLTPCTQENDVDLRALTSLKTLHVRIEDPDALITVPALLARLPPRNRFRSLAIIIRGIYPTPSERAFREFDSRLAALEGLLPHLQSVEMHLTLRAGFSEDTARFDAPGRQEGKIETEAINAKYSGKGKPYGPADWDSLLAHCMAVTDVPHLFFAEELIAAYPDAKVVLTTRGPYSWWKSYSATVGGALENPLGAMNAWLEPQTAGKIRDFWRLTSHERLLDYRVGEGCESLCDFLGKEVPPVPFPRANDTQAFHDHMAKRVLPIWRRAAVKFVVPAVLMSACLILNAGRIRTVFI
ncbi:hypothetical protein B0H11DRAFT_2432863 [Mycena galericulata]|nr:hypothetical protein B0H11DRAFT_2432863 [Mycena galericulata]